jgi:oxalate---CoA ligase
VGEAWGGVIRVLRTRDTATPPSEGEDCAADESGHVWVSTPALMRGYLDREDLTATVVADGWFSTGDIGLIDERGWLYLRGREREEINKGGMKVYPGDIDGVIDQFPEALDVCSFAQTDSLLGEDVGVAVVLRATTDEVLVKLHEWTAARLAAHQMPKRWYLLEEVPRTSRGKVNRADVASRCEGREPIPYTALLKRRD